MQPITASSHSAHDATPPARKPGARRRLTRAATGSLLGLILLAASGLGAQTIYRSVGPDGKVTFSDRPPPAAASKGSSATTPLGAGSQASLPAELQQAVSRYPVTLFTGNNCTPCNAGRALLSSRGVPFTEKTVTSNDDIEALQRLSGDGSLPLLSIGSQQLKGFSDIEWNQYLSAAGYPSSPQLPPGYQHPAATALVSSKPVASVDAGNDAAATTGSSTPTGPRPRTRPQPTPRSDAPDTGNPAGIRF